MKATREVTAKRLLQMELQRHRSIAQMVAGVAHEMNTPLGALSSNTQLTERAVGLVTEAVESDEGSSFRAAHPKAVKALAALRNIRSTATEATDRLTRVVAGLSDFARIDDADFKIILG